MKNTLTEHGIQQKHTHIAGNILRTLDDGGEYENMVAVVPSSQSSNLLGAVRL